MIDVDGACRFASDSLSAVADSDRAAAMAAYMRTEMPFYGVPKPLRRPIGRELSRRWVPATRSEYRALVEGLWNLAHREEKYLALTVARANRSYITRASIPMYRRLIVDGAWWDLVDEIAIKLVGSVLLTDRVRTTATIRAWLEHRNLWVRRTAIICQVGHKTETDTDLLFEACSKRAHETDFFIRKAIGWALRDYAWTDPEPVARFVATHEDALSGLSKREALKNI